MKEKNIWDEAAKLKIYRKPPMHPFFQIEKIDPGVNYFVLMLEQLGAVPMFSCEGHPDGFYVMFSAPAKLAEKILGCGFFRIELEGKNRWSLRGINYGNNRTRRRALRWAAESWEKQLGKLDLKKANKAAEIEQKKMTKAKRSKNDN